MKRRRWRFFSIRTLVQNQKIDAIGVLGAGTRDEYDRITFALVRQCHFDMQPVRDLAKAALAQLCRERDIDQMIASHFPHTGDFLGDFTDATKGFNTAQGVAEFLVDKHADVAQTAVRMLASCAVAFPKHLASIREGLRIRLVGHLERIDFVDPTVRREVLILVEQLDPIREAALPLILRAMDDSDAEVQKFVQRLGIATAKC